MSRQNIRLDIQYDGTDYCGWQIQSNGPTIQGILSEILARIEGRAVTLYGAGRTDAGVHAFNQVANFYSERAIRPEQWRRALNGNLPCDIRVSAVSEVDDDFHARFSARGKQYLYRIALNEIASPFEYRYYHHYPHKLDIEAIRQAAAVLLGTHDFAAFATAPDMESTVRTLNAIDIRAEDERIDIEVAGNGFLRYMVRTIVGTLIEVGRGKLSPENMNHILLSRARSQAGPTAPACGLTLVKVEYGEASKLTS